MLKKKPIKMILIIFACLFLFALLFVLLITRPGNEPYERNKDVYRQSFGILTYETLRHKPSQTDHELAKPIIAEVENAFAYIGSENDSTIKYPYNKLCYFTEEDYRDVSVNYSVDFITLYRFLNHGYLWIEYTEERYKPDGKAGHGAWGILTLVKLKKENGEWTATDIIETA